MLTVIDLEDVPREERVSTWVDVTAQALMPQRFRFTEPESFRARIASMQLGAGELADLAYSPLVAERTPRLIRQSDPELYQLALIRSGEQGIEQERSHARLKAGEFVLYDSSLPFSARTGFTPGISTSLVFQFPKSSLPLSPQRVRRLLAVPLPSGRGIGRVLSQFLAGVGQEYASCSARDAVRLGQTALDLVAAFLGGQADRDPGLPPESRRRVLFLTITAFIERNLGDPALSPSAVASAHGISPRYLQRILQEQGTTAAAFIRERRLARCRRDLADPALREVPVHAIGARWGFRSASDFNRAFRAAIGLTPGQYRASAG
ncbi:AraC family transcriptional regulator [Streptomyces fumigatiscleroticus]|nr:AraC family transcriptional regulator [Streptomyces fumigatiscleroticus]